MTDVLNRVLNDLKDVKRFKQVQLSSRKPNNRHLIHAVAPVNGTEQLCHIVPISSTENWSVASLLAIFTELNVNVDESLVPVNRLTIAIVAEDASIVYYHVHDDLIPIQEKKTSSRHRRYKDINL